MILYGNIRVAVKSYREVVRVCTFAFRFWFDEIGLIN